MTMTKAVKLTERQEKVLAWIEAYIAEHGYSPTFRELCKAFRFKSTQGAVCHLVPLRKKGFVTWCDGKTRTLRLTRKEG